VFHTTPRRALISGGYISSSLGTYRDIKRYYRISQGIIEVVIKLCIVYCVMLQVIENKFAHRGLKNGGFELEVKFQEPRNSISLRVGKVLESGWKITPVNSPVVSWS